MKQLASLPCESTLLVTLTVAQLRDLVRSELQTIVIGSEKGRSAGNEKQYLTVKEAAECTGLGASTIRVRIRRKQLPVKHVGRRVLIKHADLEAFLGSDPKSTAQD